MKTGMLLTGWLWAGTVLAQSAPSSAPSAEAKLIASLYGERIAQALNSADVNDNVALGREMLQAAGDPANPPLLRHLLGLEVLKVVSPAGTEEGARLAGEALDLADKLQPLPAVEKARLEVQILQQRLEGARKTGAATKDLAALTEELVRGQIALAKALIGEEKTDLASAVLSSAQAQARAGKLEDLEEQVNELSKELRAHVARLARIRLAEGQLQRAKESGDAEAARAARQRLGLIYLLGEGDVLKANSHLSGTGDGYESAVAALVAFLQEKKVPAGDKGADNVEALSKAALAAETKQAQQRLAAGASALGQAFLRDNPQGLAATKVRMVMVQIQNLSTDTPADKLLAKLKTNYKGLAAKIELLKDGTVRFTYDFSSRKMLQDWDVKSGTWDMIAGKEVLGASPAAYQYIRTDNRLQFRADKPLTLMFRASGTSDLTGVLYFDTTYTREVLCQLGASNNSVTQVRDGYGSIWSDRRLRVVRGAVHKIEIVWDGQNRITYIVNGQTLCKADLRYRLSDPSRCMLSVGLETAGYPAAFDDVVIEGTVLEEPGSVPARRPSTPGPVPTPIP